MATTYVVLQETDQTLDDQPLFLVVGRAEAASAKQARHIVAETLAPEVVDAGVFLHAVPARNWNGGRGKEQAETTRRIRSA